MVAMVAPARGAEPAATPPGAKPADAPADTPATPPGMIPVAAGPFLMGCNPEVDLECQNDEKPGKSVEVAAFEIDPTEVTVAQFAACVAAGACSSDGLGVPYFGGQEHAEFADLCNWQKRDDHPINCVSREAAMAYCGWAGKRLPTEAEWEKAARGTDGRKYPWGNAGYDTAGKVANIADETAKKRYPELSIAAGYDDGFAGTAPVKSFPAGATPGGASDMIGNVAEWMADEYASSSVVRGGSFYRGPQFDRASARGRASLGSRAGDVGFRCVR
jgi:formylglycine-generating enzyme required for sulfatase activity